MKGHAVKFVVVVAAILGLAAGQVSAAEEGFPLRAKFPKVNYLTTEALFKDYQKVIVVDVRSKIEYDVIHVNKAVHLPMSTAMFVKDLEKLRSKEGTMPIAFYCNGHTCAKSYEATEQAMEAGFKAVFAYDAGIYDWVKAYPDKGTLLGTTPVPVNKLISKEAFAKRKVSYGEFKKKAENPDAMIIDIREPVQREVVPPLAGLRNIPSDRLVDLLKSGEFKGKELLILDAVGKQVEWVQYYLEQYGYEKYVFLDKGVGGIK